ncbi:MULTISPECIES: class I SAM-dependent methyltransferase [unclassified Streptomyces]|uniref:class I SAM-dependent methyltransferase n=1 Tax=unclassified Streptomyces TaxID=2593676 RepID=UPI0021C77D06|nr:class I SAM-dependent methyltransferase [Streptomyces sp. FIT100]UUN28977.1 class I SAM-dependent methyltransferase [Streptomyces sp. FIT100]
MRPLLTSTAARKALRPIADLIDQRIARGVRAANSELLGELAALRRRQRSMELLLDSTGRGNPRMPIPAHLEKLISEIVRTTGDDAANAERNVAQAYRTLVAMEALGVGRVAGGTMNICGKLATVPLLDPPNDEILEIGTLYGMFSAALLRMMERAGRDPHLTIVDPLGGSQLQPGAFMPPDPTGTPVGEPAVRSNLALAGAAGAAARVQQGFSEDPAVRAAVSDRSYGVVIVDGDHSEAGVTADLDWVEQIIAPGGIVVLDDYGDTKWPGVRDAVEKHLAGDSRLTFLGRTATSGYLRAEK